MKSRTRKRIVNTLNRCFSVNSLKIISFFLVLYIIIVVFSAYQVKAQTQSGVLLRVDVALMYMESRDIIFQIQSIAVKNGVLVGEYITVKIWVEGTLKIETLVRQNEIRSVNLGRYPVGIYKFETRAYAEGMQSSLYKGDFAVLHDPVPYSAHFLNGGKEFCFESKDPDENKTFTIRMYGDTGAEIRELQTFRNVRKLNVRCPDNLISVRFDIYDCWGWRNFENRPSDDVYVGASYLYLYHSELYEPMKSQMLSRLITIIVALTFFVIAILFIINKWMVIR